jgi:alpha-L-fucosidase
VRHLSTLLVLAVFLVGFRAAALHQDWPEAHPPVGEQPRRPAGYQAFRYPQSPDRLWREEGASLRERAGRRSRDVARVIDGGPFRADRASLGTHPCPEWFLDAKFGMFIDWGPWSVAGWAPQAEKAIYPDWYEFRLFKEFRDYHVKTWGADIGPDDLIQLLRGDAFKPADLIALAQRSGMRYVVPFLKHHGGYALWDSSYTHRDSMEWGLGRDIAQEFSRVARAAGLQYGAYVSLGEWNYPVVEGADIRSLGFDGTTSAPLSSDTPFISGKVPVSHFARDYLVPSLTELIDRADPDLLWFDGEWEADATVWQSAEIAAYYYNRAAASGREVVINDRFGKDTRGQSGWGDFFTSEYHVIEGFQSHPWEENRSLSHSYGYNWEESFDDRFVLSEEQALDLLLRVVANGGNLLLMISPDGSGRVPPNQVRRLQFLGAWLARHGEAVYATRPLGLERQPDWGYLTRSKTGGRLYCIVRRWPDDGRLVVPVKASFQSARLLGGGPVPVRAQGDRAELDVSQVRPPDAHASVIVLDVAP